MGRELFKRILFFILQKHSNRADDTKYGFVVFDTVSPQKPRILLMLGLSKTSDPASVQGMLGINTHTEKETHESYQFEYKSSSLETLFRLYHSDAMAIEGTLPELNLICSRLG